MIPIGFLYALGAAVAWGFVYTIDQLILNEVSPRALLLIDAVLTMIIALPFLIFYRGVGIPTDGISLKTWAYILIALFIGILANYFIFSSISSSGASYASIIEISYPFFVVIFSYFILKAVPNWSFLIGAIFLFIGSAIIVFFNK